MPIPLKLDYVIDRTLALQATTQQRALRNLTGLKVSAAEAGTLWTSIMDHKWYISERLGRDVGVRVAAIDYIENIRPPAKFRRTVGALPARLRMMEPLTL